MKKYIVLCSAIIFFSCNNEKTEDLQVEDDSLLTDSTSMNKPPSSNPDSKLYVWRASPDYTKYKNEAATPSILQTDSLIKGLNEYYADVYLEKLKQSGDTIYTEIKDSRYLSSQMGSTGAEMYLADVILNLTSVPGVKFVTIKMQEGDHMQPGTWSADNFKKYKQVIQ